MQILVLNCGGSSFKYKVFAFPEERVLAQGAVERIGKEDAFFRHTLGMGTQAREKRQTLPVADHAAAIDLALTYLAHPEWGTVQNWTDFTAVGHRVVHAGRRFAGSVLITDEVLAVLHECIPLAPLHNPVNIAGIEACRRLMPTVPQVAVFDNTFHRDLAPAVYTYALPYRYYTDYGIRRYGFHGITFRYMTERAAALLGRDLGTLRIVSLMLGSGTTANAFAGGRSVDVSTGFTPLEGLVQSTRSGDLDPAVVTHIMAKENLTPAQMDQILNKESGWLGISGVSNDLREVSEAAAAGNTRAQLAVDVFVYRCKKYIGAYAAAMGGIDALVFSGGVGERAPRIRAQICAGLEFLGVKLDHGRNEGLTGEGIISPPDAAAAVVVVQTQEELVIARDAYQLVKV